MSLNPIVNKNLLSNLNAKNIIINTDEKLSTNTNITGSNVIATENLYINTNNLNVKASQDNYVSSNDSESVNGSIAFTMYGGGGGTAGLGYGQQNSNSNSIINNNSQLMGNNVNINRGCEFFTSAHLETVIDIKDNVTFSPNVKLYSAGHDYKYLNLPDTAGDIIIKEYVWIGGNSVVLQGVTIGEYSIVSANSVVTKDIPPYSIVAGIPATIIKKREIYE